MTAPSPAEQPWSVPAFIQAVTLAEFSAVRDEIAARSRFQNGYSTLSVSLTALTFSFGITTSPALLLVVPVISSVFGLLWLDHAVQIDRLGTYIATDLRDNLRQLEELEARLNRPHSQDKEWSLLTWETRRTPRRSKQAPFWLRFELPILLTFTVPGLIALITAIVRLIVNGTQLPLTITGVVIAFAFSGVFAVAWWRQSQSGSELQTLPQTRAGDDPVPPQGPQRPV